MNYQVKYLNGDTHFLENYGKIWTEGDHYFVESLIAGVEDYKVSKYEVSCINPITIDEE